MYRLIFLFVSFVLLSGCFSNYAAASENKNTLSDSTHYNFIGNTIKEKQSLVRYLDIMFYMSFYEAAYISGMTLTEEPLDIKKTQTNIDKLPNDNIQTIFYWVVNHARVLNFYEDSVSKGDVSVFPGGILEKAEKANIRYKLAYVSILLHNSLYAKSSGSMDLLDKGGKIDNINQAIAEVIDDQKNLAFSYKSVLAYYNLYWNDIARKAQFSQPVEPAVIYAYQEMEKLNSKDQSRYLLYLLANDLADSTLKIVEEINPDPGLIQHIKTNQKKLNKQLTSRLSLSQLDMDMEFSSSYIFY